MRWDLPRWSYFRRARIHDQHDRESEDPERLAPNSQGCTASCVSISDLPSYPRFPL